MVANSHGFLLGDKTNITLSNRAFMKVLTGISSSFLGLWRWAVGQILWVAAERLRAESTYTKMGCANDNFLAAFQFASEWFPSTPCILLDMTGPLLDTYEYLGISTGSTVDDKNLQCCSWREIQLCLQFLSANFWIFQKFWRTGWR